MQNIHRFYIFFFRSSGIAIKAVFMLLAARSLTSAQYGEFVLFVSNMAIVLSFLGLNLNQYTSRKLASTEDKRALIVDHFSAVAVSGCLILGILYFFRNMIGLENTIYFFLMISFLEHMTNEAYFLLLPLGKALLANVVFFLKVVSSYGLICAYFLIEDREKISFTTIFTIWASSLTLISVALSLKYPPKTKPSLSILKTGWKIGLVYLVISILTKAFFNLDKVVLSHYLSLSEVGVYGMIFSIAWTIHTLVEASLVGPSIKEFLTYPEEHRRLVRLIGKTTGLYAFLWLLLALAFNVVVNLLRKPELAEKASYLHLFLLAGYFYTISLCLSMKLYAQHQDKAILHSSIIGFIAFGVLMITNNSSGLTIAANLVVVSLVYLIALGASFLRQTKGIVR